ncbi:stringent starvation B family protein [Orientia chuto str. Dubai]|uniref:Stringent starvation B family protein n=1 Tax=Orientia chuto str. Dubai TaxID=1359168 RepID=A0A0F3MMT8_9RICK|nr:ClpXP protease specificity-enhancing factor SspB [Candidatus Orientia mediorientalis]KJV57068.1 stringent starvation B family protein [Orientia chuto str. Dubai]
MGKINYEELVDQSMLNVVKQALKFVSASGDLEDNYFYISFCTTFPGVKISEHLRTKYTEQMTIVLQHQFSNLVIKHDFFSVCLSFSGKVEEVVVPWKSIMTFIDPVAQLRIKLIYYVNKHKNQLHKSNAKNQNQPSSPVSIKGKLKDKKNAIENKVVSLDSFRRRSSD